MLPVFVIVWFCGSLRRRLLLDREPARPVAPGTATAPEPTFADHAADEGATESGLAVPKAVDGLHAWHPSEPVCRAAEVLHRPERELPLGRLKHCECGSRVVHEEVEFEPRDLEQLAARRVVARCYDRSLAARTVIGWPGGRASSSADNSPAASAEAASRMPSMTVAFPTK